VDCVVKGRAISRWGWRASRTAALALVALLPAGAARTQGREADRPRAERGATQPGDQLRIYVLTFGPGGDLFARFGHNALWIRDDRAGTDLVYNFGTIPPSKHLVADFMKGRMLYSVSVSTLARTVEHYRGADQSIDVQELDLPPARRAWLDAAVRRYALPEHRWYLYDYYLDNCSTKVRDLVDEAVGGRLRRVAQVPATLTRREHTLRLTDGDPISIAIDVGLGPRADGGQTRWDEMFLPAVLHDALATLTVEDRGGPRSLVKRQFSLHQARRPRPRTTVPERLPAFAAVGLLLGAAFVGLGAAARRSSGHPRLRRAALAALWTGAALLSLVAGLVGSLLVYFWAATDHVIAHQNQNLFPLNPLALGVVGLAISAPWSPRAIGRARTLAWILVGVTALGLLAKALPWFVQRNGAFIALALPAWSGLALGLQQLAGSGASPASLRRRHGARFRRGTPPA
jgi:hypothetical protein